MQKLLADFAKELRKGLLDLLWSQWTALGVSGQEGWTGGVLDPEAMLLFSCTLSRYDARLFDAILDWLNINGHFINVQRIKRMLRLELFLGGSVLGAVAAKITTSVDRAKWAGLIPEEKGKDQDMETLFFLSDGSPMPLVGKADPVFAAQGFHRDEYVARNVAGPFSPNPQSNLLLRLRALIGLTARCEILSYLLLNERGSPRAMARDCYYFPATLTKAMADMARSGYLISRVEGRQRHYSLVPGAWRDLFLDAQAPGRWIIWPRIFSALEEIHHFLSAPDLPTKSTAAQASSLRRVLKSGVLDRIQASGLPVLFGDEPAHSGEQLIPFFIKGTRAILYALNPR